MTLEALTSEALALPPAARAKLAEQLVHSLHTVLPSQNDAIAAEPKGVPIYGRGRGKMNLNMDDDSHLADFAEYMS